MTSQSTCAKHKGGCKGQHRSRPRSGALRGAACQAHRDLKPENVLLDGAGAMKLSDFGLGALPDSARADGMLKTACGTPNYVAPEVLQRVGYAGAPADIWSLGAGLHHLCTSFLTSRQLSQLGV